MEDYSNISVLITDDEPAYRKILGIILEKFFNVKVFEAENPKVCFEVLKHQKIDLLFLDMQMPYMDGLTALYHIRQEPHTKDLPVIACTALSTAELITALFKLHIKDYILKPFTEAIVVNKVKKIIVEIDNNQKKADENQ